MNVSQAIAALLYDHDTVIVPALGAFVRHDESAQVNVITNEFQKPSSSLSFDPSQREENSLVMDYLMLHGELSDEDARQEIAAFVADCYAKMREGETVTLDGIGTLAFNKLQEIVFEPEPSADFNAEAFGLSDLEVKPVYGDFGRPNVNAEETETSDASSLAENGEEEQSTDDNEAQKRYWWLWLILVIILLGGAALWYFKFRPVAPEPVSPKPDTPTIVEPTIIEPDTIIPLTDTIMPTTDTVVEPVQPVVDPVQPVVDSVRPIADTVKPIVGAVNSIEVVKPQPESKAFIVGGCFSIEQNALNMAKEAIEQGCAESFVMKRGTKFFVCYGQYTSTSEAKVALPGILEKYNRKAWILF